MNREKYLKFHRKICDDMVKLTEAKNRDYCGKSGDDAFANFSRVESLGVCSVEQGFLVRMVDKVCRVASFVDRGELSVKDESVKDTLMDLANYSILLMGYLESKKETRVDYRPGVTNASA